MGETVAVTTRISIQDKHLLDRLAESTGRTRTFLIARAVRDYLENQAWQIEEIQKAIAEAEAGDFAKEKEVETFFAKWKVQGQVA